MMRLLGTVLSFFALHCDLGEAKSEAKTNWQDEWRVHLDTCVKDKTYLFTDPDGKVRTRKIRDMSKLVADSLIKEEREKALKSSSAGKSKKKPKAKSKMTKKERMNAELLGHLAGSFDKIPDADPISDKMKKQYQQTADGIVGQMIRNSKLSPDTELTVREFCDLAFRSGQASPLDQDEPEKEEKDEKEEAVEL
eukprot:TRINITY_DN27358_c0_g2_i1.p1 TRINITY_DN27358_c0_g2~~TRINITY_DN27358_c0_g2_i1.p1  ORF type:complete len:194 (-),score=42.11 TRINITY_DN27358_c0_g2_i1:80-661(-)